MVHINWQSTKSRRMKRHRSVFVAPSIRLSETCKTILQTILKSAGEILGSHNKTIVVSTLLSIRLHHGFLTLYANMCIFNFELNISGISSRDSGKQWPSHVSSEMWNYPEGRASGSRLELSTQIKIRLHYMLSNHVQHVRGINYIYSLVRRKHLFVEIMKSIKKPGL
jgi:hypothetical protein